MPCLGSGGEAFGIQRFIVEFAEYDRLISKNTQLELTTSGGILHTDWETQFRHTERTWSAFTSSYLVE